MSIAIAVFSLCIVSGLILLLVRRIEVGLFCLLAVELLDLTFGVNATVVGRLHLSALDVVSMCLLAAGAIRFVHSLRVICFARVLAAGYVVLFLWSFARGCTANGFLAAANEARGFIGPLAAMLYFSDAAVDEESIRRLVRLYLLFGFGLCLVMLLAIAGLPVGLAAIAHPVVDDRVLPSGAAAAIALCGFFSLANTRSDARRLIDLVLPPLFFIAAIALRHRTVWMMLLAGMIGLLFADGWLFRRAVPIAVLASAVVAGIAMFGGDAIGSASRDGFAQAFSSNETWEWRVNGWQEYLFDADQTPLTVLAGKPMGDGWGRIDPESHLLQLAPPHSEFVTEYLRVGSLGLVLVVLFVCRPLWILRRRDPVEGLACFPCASIWFAVVAMALIYGVTYSIEPESYALIGVASALASGARAPEPRIENAIAEGGESSPGFAN